MGDSVPAPPVQLTVHSILAGSRVTTRRTKNHADVALCWKSVTPLLQRNKESIYFISSHTQSCVPVVSSTLPIGGFSPEPQGPGLFSWGRGRGRQAYDPDPMSMPPAPLSPADYLKKILTARVYDVAVESAL